MAWLKIGSKRLGVEFAFLAGSTLFIFLIQHNIVIPYLKGQDEWAGITFYLIFMYNVINYL